MQTRVDQLVPYGYTDTAISTFHAFGDRLIREFALELGLPPRRARAVAPGDGRVPRASTCSSWSWTSTGRSATRRSSSTRSRRCSRGRRTRTSRPTPTAPTPSGWPPRRPRPGVGRCRRRGGDRGRTATPRRRSRRRRAGRRSSRGRTRPTSGCSRRTARSTSATRSSLALRLLRESPAARERVQAPLPVRPRGRVPGHEPRPVGARRAARAAAPQRHGRGRRRPVDLQVPGRGDQQHPRVPRALPGGPGRRAAPELPVARADPRRLVPARPPQRPGPPRGPGRDRQAARSRSGGASGARRSATRRSRPAPRRRTGSPRTSPAACATARRTATCAVLVRANAAADPILRSLNLEGIPWRFSGTSGLYARPEVRLLLSFLRAVADTGSSVDVYALAASELYGLGGEDLVSIVTSARRRNRSVFEVLEELQRQPGILRLRPETRAAATKLVDDLRAYVDAGPRAARGRGPVRVPARLGLAQAARGDGLRRERGGALEHRALLRHHPGPVGAPRRRPRGVRRDATSRRSSRRATTRPRRTSTPRRTRSR